MPWHVRVLLGALLGLLFLIGGDSRTELLSCAQSVVVNGDLDTDLSAWSPVEGSGYAWWDSRDAEDSPFSGSVFLVNNWKVDGQNTSISQCRPLTGGLSYDFSAKAQPYTLSPLGTRQTRHTGFGHYYVLLNYYPRASCGGAPLSDYVLFDFNNISVWAALAETFTAPASAASARITLGVFKNGADGELSCSFDDVFLFVSGSSSKSEPTALCLGKGRFKAEAQWTTRDGRTGPAGAVALTPDTGYFWFFDPVNVEMLVKVLNGCATNSSYWVFAGGLTDVGVVMTVTDTQTGGVRTYQNPQGTAFLPVQDTTAFRACPSSPSASATTQQIGSRGAGAKTIASERPAERSASANLMSACETDAQTLCLNGGRFAVSTQWTTPDGRMGFGTATALTPDTGDFWFFNPSNVETVVKVLDGCGVNSSFWAFAGGLTDVEVVTTVTDTQTGAVQTYRNAQGTAFLPIQDTAAFAACQGP